MNPQSYDFTKKYIGNSFGQCVVSILSGDMPIENVLRIEAGTSIPNMESLKTMISKGYFGSDFDNDLTLELCEYLLFRGMVRQCRLEGDWKINPEAWTEESKWKRNKFQETSASQAEHSQGYTDRLNKKINAQIEIHRNRAVLDCVKVVEDRDEVVV